MTNDQPAPEFHVPDPLALSKAMADIAQRSQRLVTDFLTRQAANGSFGMTDPLNVAEAFFKMTASLMSDPAKLMDAQAALWRDYLALWEQTARRMMGVDAKPLVEPKTADRRFRDTAWEENEVFNYIKQSYLLTARWLQSTVARAEGLDEKTRQKIDFYARQFVDALSPTNFVLTNPEVLRATVESGGENLVRGLQNLLADLERGKGNLSIRMTDYEAFKVGENIAVTPGKVVFRNALMELIQYAPSTETVFRRPLLIVPPWINKYYVLDLRESNSFIRWTVGRGHTVFVISWVNPDQTLAEKTFDDYLLEGPMAALEAIAKATGESEVNIAGYCIGGTLLACLLAYMAAKGDRRIASATFLATLVDFADAGEISVFIDEEQIAALERRMRQRGYLEGHEMATTFNLLRANDLIWSFVVNNYLLGKDPFPFDLLYWNADSTRLPAAMHSFYLRNMYQDNKLVEPGALTVAGAPMDLGRVEVPSYVLSTREDHIAPWKSAYVATRLFRGPVRFVLSASGHIAGVINHPDAKKYGYWTNAKTPSDADEWLADAAPHQGSWWPDWARWLEKFAGARDVPARKPGGGKLKPLADAPGTYVKMRSE